MINSQAIQADAMKSQHYFRALICFAAIGSLASQIDLHNFLHSLNWLLCGTMGFCLVYMLVAFLLLRKISPQKQDASIRLFSWLDACLIGFVVALSNFALLPTVLFVTMIQFNALLVGGGKRWTEDALALACGAFLGLMIHRPTWVFSTQLSVSLASLIGICTYFCAAGFFTFTQIRTLKNNLKIAEQNSNLLKVKTHRMSRYLSPQVWSAINESRDNNLKTERKRLTIFFSDIKDFSHLSEELEAETLTEILNTYLKEMSKIVEQFGGSVDKFIGDGIMVIFGDHQSQGIKHDTIRCVTMAIEMRKRMKALQDIWISQGIKRPMHIRMGINTGYCTVGTFGTTHHLDYTALGTHVNLASRLESAASPDEILISHEAWSLCRDTVMCRDKGEVSVKGFTHPIKVYSVVGLRKDLGRNQSYFEHTLEGFSMHLDMDKLRNYDRDRAIAALERAADTLKEKQ